MEYIPVNIPPGVKEKCFSDDRASLHFFIAEGKLGRGKKWPSDKLVQEQLFPFIAEEVQRLCRDEGFSFRQFAVLVRDRFQAEHLQAFLKEWGIPSLARRSTSLVEAPAFLAMKHIVNAVLHPLSHSGVAKALGGKIIAWDHHRVRAFKDGEGIEGDHTIRCSVQDNSIEWPVTVIGINSCHAMVAATEDHVSRSRSEGAYLRKFASHHYCHGV